MNKEEIVNEFKRWIDAGRPAVWVKCKEDDEWSISAKTCWSQPNRIWYIVDDKQAELRKLAIDKPDTKFQVKYYKHELTEPSEDGIAVGWKDTIPYWNPEWDYRIKPKEWYEDKDMIGKPIWVRDCDYECWELDIFEKYNNKKEENSFECRFDYWAQAKPVKPEECYKGVK